MIIIYCQSYLNYMVLLVSFTVRPMSECVERSSLRLFYKRRTTYMKEFHYFTSAKMAADYLKMALVRVWNCLQELYIYKEGFLSYQKISYLELIAEIV